MQFLKFTATATDKEWIKGNRDLTDTQAEMITELLDKVSPKGVYKEPESEIRKKLKACKNILYS